MVTPMQASNGAFAGRAVLWGGYIVAKNFDANGKPCVEVVAQRLDRSTGRPQRPPKTLATGGGQHFFACGAQVESADYGLRRLATFAGSLVDTQERTLAQSCDGRDPILGTTKVSTERGCSVRIPVVAVTDGKSWPNLQLGRVSAAIMDGHGLKG